YKAGQTSVLLTLKMAHQTSSPVRKYLLRTIIGVGLLSFVFIDHPVSYLAILLSIILLFPLLLLILSMILKPILKMIFGSAGNMASRNITKQLNRNASTSAILAVGIAIILLISAVIETDPQGYKKAIKNTYGGDLRVTSEIPWTEEDKTTMLSHDAVANVSSLTEATPITWENVEGNERQFSVIGVDNKGPSLFESPKK